MNRTGHETTTFFVGGEVEKTPAFAKKTLFVVGSPNITSIEKHAAEHKVQHIFMGANHSFDCSYIPDSGYWDNTITSLLDSGYWVTLDYPAHQHETVLKMLNKGIWQSRIFVPLLSVRIPKVEISNVNLTVKIDDVDFNATNPGVWCMHFREVTDSNRFTDWTEYSADTVINYEILASETLPTSALNDSLAGLDLVSKSSLKPENEEEKTAPNPVIANVEDALEAYTEGTTSDSLSSKVPKKAVKK